MCMKIGELDKRHNPLMYEVIKEIHQMKKIVEYWLIKKVFWLDLQNMLNNCIRTKGKIF